MKFSGIKKIIIGGFSIVLIAGYSIGYAYAYNLKDAFGGILTNVGTNAGYETGASPLTVVGTVIQVALSLLGVIFLVLMVYGGYLWMNARGQEQEVNRAKDTIRMAIIGLAIVVAAYAISYFVVSALGEGVLQPAK
jgi:hypothetical protein